MRILFVSSSPLRKEISIGNTFLNLFSGMEDVEFASIYTRSGKPDASVRQAFCITEKMLIQNLLGKGPAGMRTESEVQSGCVSAEEASKQVAFAKSRRWTVFFWLQELVWRVGKWKSKALNAFIQEYKPDIIFTVLSSSSFLNRLILYVQSVAKVPLVIYAWDNNYSMKQWMFSPLKWFNHFRNRAVMRKVVKKADLLYVISGVQKTDYEKAFHKKCKILTKGADFSGEAPLCASSDAPLQLLYTGNIGLNRWKSLAHIANVLEKINQDGIKAQLRIYTANAVTKAMRDALHKEKTSFLMGSVPASEVAKLQREADILVHVEALDIKNKLLVRQSFSTKLVDYFRQAKAIVAYGPNDVASIAYLTENDAAITAQTERELEEKLRLLLANRDRIQECGRKAWECGKKNHQSATIQAMLRRDLEESICKKTEESSYMQ